MYKDADKRLTGNDVFEGYAIDLIKDVADILSEFLAGQKSIWYQIKTNFAKMLGLVPSQKNCNFMSDQIITWSRLSDFI